MNVLSDAAVKYLRGERRLARLATVGSDGMPHVTPVGWSLSADGQAVEAGVITWGPDDTAHGEGTT